ncbi:hypothetical protein Hanom_Chr05g00420571 [Helianthus anomalus]
MYVKELKRVAIKREHGIQYFNSLMSILSLPHYDVSTLTQIRVFSCLGNGWMEDKLYKPQFPERVEIRFSLDSETNTGRYKLTYKAARVMKKIM